MAPIVLTAARCGDIAEAAEHLVVERGRDEGDAEGQPTRWKPAGTAIAARSSRFMKFV